MSLHHFSLSIPAATSGYYEDSKLVEVGTITQVEIYYPLNNNRFGKIWFSDGEHDIIPAESDGYLTGNGNVQQFELSELIRSGRLSMRGTNGDPDFEHTIDAWINIIPAAVGDYIGF